MRRLLEPLSYIGTLGGPYAFAASLNDAGQVTGSASYAGAEFAHAFLWSASSGMRDLGTIGGPASFGMDISETGQIAGISTTGRAILRDMPSGGAPRKACATSVSCRERRHRPPWRSTMQEWGGPARPFRTQGGPGVAPRRTCRRLCHPTLRVARTLRLLPFQGE